MAAALTAHVEGGDPFETARTRFLYGGRLRRTGHRVVARDHLAAALSAFAAMDLTHWVAVAERGTGRDRRDCPAATAPRATSP